LDTSRWSAMIRESWRTTKERARRKAEPITAMHSDSFHCEQRLHDGLSITQTSNHSAAGVEENSEDGPRFVSWAGEWFAVSRHPHEDGCTAHERSAESEAVESIGTECPREQGFSKRKLLSLPFTNGGRSHEVDKEGDFVVETSWLSWCTGIRRILMPTFPVSCSLQPSARALNQSLLSSCPKHHRLLPHYRHSSSGSTAASLLRGEPIAPVEWEG
jgi:hypothetical protein